MYNDAPFFFNICLSIYVFKIASYHLVKKKYIFILHFLREKQTIEEMFGSYLRKRLLYL